MLKVVQSNRVENLAAELLRTQAEAPLADPLAEEVVVVQSPGMALWLRTEQAKAFGIAAGVAYPLPSLFAWRLIRTLVPAPADDPYAKRNLRWTLFRLLAALPQDAPAFAPLRHYLEGGEQGLKRFQLAERIADLFDQYLVYRPSWLAAWRRGQRLGLPGPHEAWQSALWAQAVAALGAAPDRATLLTAALERLAHSPPGALDDLLVPVAPRVALFGLSALPPGQLALFTALARHRPVTLYFLNPSADYWAEVLRPAVVARRQAEALKVAARRRWRLTRRRPWPISRPIPCWPRTGRWGGNFSISSWPLMVRRRCSTTLESGTKKRRWPSFSRLCSVGTMRPSC